MNDPAFLFYSSDFLTGCMDLTMEERGQYITLMCMQHQKGHLSEKTICLSLGLAFNDLTQELKSKYITDDDKNYYNERLEQEIIKRAEYTESRRKNGSKGGRPKEEKKKAYVKPYGKPYENHIENENINRDINIIIEYLNNKIDSNYKSSSKKNRELIQARLNEKYTVEDFKKVIDNKVTEWTGTEFEKFLRPETLFSNKFEGYLNQKQNVKQEKKKDYQNYNQRKYNDKDFDTMIDVGG
jgi:uncharacterized phage protein (TIGR02220 family)